MAPFRAEACDRAQGLLPSRARRALVVVRVATITGRPGHWQALELAERKAAAPLGLAVKAQAGQPLQEYPHGDLAVEPRERCT
jgi:hypothetical protein